MWLAALAAALCLLFLSTGEGGGMTSEEKRVAQTLSCVEGAGRVRVTLYQAERGGAFGGGSQPISGALVVAEGAGDIAVRLHLTQAVETLLSLPSGSVMVLEMEGKR